MKTTLTIEHSAELIRLGVKPERATCIMQVDMPEMTCSAELIDALYNILVKLIKRKDINPKDL